MQARGRYRCITWVLDQRLHHRKARWIAFWIMTMTWRPQGFQTREQAQLHQGIASRCLKWCDDNYLKYSDQSWDQRSSKFVSMSLGKGDAAYYKIYFFWVQMMQSNIGAGCWSLGMRCKLKGDQTMIKVSYAI